MSDLEQLLRADPVLETTVDDEDLNVPSPQRLEVLGRISARLKHKEVSRGFWALCQFADVEKLRFLALSEPFQIEGWMDTCNHAVDQWIQRHRGMKRSHSGTDLSSTSKSSRSDKNAENAKKRDGNCCLLTNRGPRETVQACHIYPHSVLKENGPVGFWGTLKQFWTDERIARWESAIMAGADKKYFDGCHNLLTMTPSVHTDWNNGAFALKPMPASGSSEDDGFCIRVQFFWQPYYDKTWTKPTLSEEPKRAEKTFSGGAKVLWNKWRIDSGCLVDDGEEKIVTGHVFVFTTSDPKKLPLPNRDLLEMQWMLQRVRALRGSAETTHDDADSEDGIAVVGNAANIEPWLASVPMFEARTTSSSAAVLKIVSH